MFVLSFSSKFSMQYFQLSCMMNDLALEDFVYVSLRECMCNLSFVFKLQKTNNIPIVSQKFSSDNYRFSLYWFVLEIEVIFFMCVLLCKHVCICICVCIYMYIYLYACLFVGSMCMYICICVYIHIYIFRVRFWFQVFDLICTSFAISGLFTKHIYFIKVE